MVVRNQEPFLYQDEAGKLRNQLQALQHEANLFNPPSSLDQINRLLSSAPVDLRRLGEAIHDHSGLVTEALKLCNSSLFRLPQPVSSLEQAVIITDADVVRTLLLACWIIQCAGQRLLLRENRLFWRHSLRVAQLSRRISEWTALATAEEAFLAGLFHDLGDLPFLAMLSKEDQERAFESAGESLESQRRRFGVDHCELGRRMGVAIGFPASLIEVFAGHHQRGTALFSSPLVGIVSAAELISQPSLGLENPDPHALPPAQLIKSALAEYLPGLSHSVSLRLVEALEADLASATAQATARPEDAWSDAWASPEQRTTAAKQY